MKKHKLIFIFILLLTITMAACSNPDKEEGPEEIFDRYAAHWMDKDYPSMYEMLSTDSKNYISQEDFLSRYENIYDGVSVENIEITFDKEIEVPEDTSHIEIPYSFKMDTLIGALDFDHQVNILLEENEEDKVWTIQWNESMIFPQMEEGDKVRVTTSPARRGKIIDRNGIALAEVGEIQTIGIVPQDLGENGETTKSILAQAFETTLENINGKLQASWVQDHLFVPIGSLSAEDNSKILELTALPGVLAQRQSARVYHFGQAAAHLTGYTGSISAEELEDLEGQGYNQHSSLGKNGLELIYEEKLREKEGKTVTILDKNNIVKEILGETQPENGQDIFLTIDILLQEKIYEEMGQEKGTALAMNYKTGEVLALVNKPSYDPNLFILGLSTQQWNRLNEDPDKPLLNRFAQRYSPGSVFKPIVAAIGLENTSLDQNQAISITGLQWQKDPSWGNYSVTRVTDPGRPVNLRDALVYSDNIYFAQTVLNMGEDAFIEGANKFGFGEEIDFPYPIRSSQLTNEGSFSNEIQLADSGYGQGQVLVSPLHLTAMYTAFLNEGNMVKPVLVNEGDQQLPIMWKEKIIDPATANLIRDNLIQVIEDPQGTGRNAKIEGRILGGKTGTAEIKASQDETGVNNGTFIAFDSQDQDIIVIIQLEDVAGSSVAVPKVRNIINNYKPL